MFPARHLEAGVHLALLSLEDRRRVVTDFDHHHNLIQPKIAIVYVAPADKLHGTGTISLLPCQG